MYLVIAAVAYVYLASTCSSPLAHLDTAFEWLSARDCVEGRCPASGPGTSVLGLKHGALWGRLLATGIGVGFDALDFQRVVLLLQGLGAVVVAFAARKLAGGKDRAAVLALCYVVVLRIIERGDILWTPVLAHTGAALFVTGLVLALLGRGPGYVAMAGLGFALASLSHALMLVLLPVLVFGAILAPGRPFANALAVVVTVAVPFVLDSWDTVVSNADFFQRSGLAWPIAAVIMASGASALSLRARWCSTTADRRARLALFGVLAAVLGTGYLAPRYAGSPASVRYFFCLPPVVALIAALGLERGLARLSVPKAILALRVLAVFVLMAAAAATQRDILGFRPESWLVSEVDALAVDFQRHGVGYAEAFRRVQGPGSRNLIGMLAAVDRHPIPGPVDDGADRTLLVLRFRKHSVPASLPSGWRVVDLRDPFAALVREAPPGLSARALAVCHPDDPDGPACVAIDRSWRDSPSGKWLDRQYPSALPREACGHRTSGRSGWRWTVDASAGSVRVLLPEPEWEGCRWALDGGGIEVVVPQGPVPHYVTASTTLGGACRDRCWPPSILAAPVDDPVVAAFLADPDVLH